MNQDNLWDYGSQVSFDPWGAWRYFSANKNHKYNRIVNCTMEVLHVFKKYLDNNKIGENHDAAGID
jgi:glutamate/tyrosine decarboxylase-like PLP-dependent enzyme